jgi:hypothetical protein
VPKNPMNPFYLELAFNPLGASWVDLGLGGQANTKLEWSTDDVEAVARYLNARHYHYPLPKR